MSSLKKNIAYQSFYEILILILPFFTSPYIARVMGADYIGLFSYTYSIAYYFHLFGMLGIKFYGNRSIAKVRDSHTDTVRVYNEIFALHEIVSILSAIVYFVFCVFGAKYRTYAFLQGFLVLSSVFDVSWLFFGLERFKQTVTWSTVIKVVSVVLIFCLVKSKNDFPVYILIMTGGQFLNSLILFILSFKVIEYKMPRITELKKHIKPLLILFIPILALSLFKYMDKIMLGGLGEKKELGYYENAEKLINIPLSVVFAFGSVMLPRITNVVAQDNKASAEKYLRLTVKFLVGLSFAMAFGLAAVSTVFAPVFWGKGFVKSGELIALLAITIPFSTLASIIRNQDMIPNGHDMYYSVSIVLGAVVNLVVNYLLIPRYQSLGVTIGTIVAEIVVCCSELWFVRKSNAYYKYLLSTILFVPASLIMYILVTLLGKIIGIHIYTPIIQVAVGVLVFCLLIVPTFWVSKDEDYKSVFSVLKRDKTSSYE